MPIFAYRCTKCGYLEEMLHHRDVDNSGMGCRLNHPADGASLVCDGVMQKLLSAVPFTFNTGPVIKDVIHHG